MNDSHDEHSPYVDLPLGNASARVILEHLFNDLPEAAIISSAERRILAVNTAAARLFRCTKQELVGQSAAILYASEPDFIEQGAMRHHEDTNAQQGRHFRQYKRRDGNVFTGENIGGPVNDNNREDNGSRVMPFMLLIRDVTDRLASDKVMEQLYEISSNPDLSFEQSRGAILQLGCDYFGMPQGVVSHIENDHYEVLAAADTNDGIQAGQVYDVRDTACFEIVARRGPYAVDRATQPEICDHPAYQRFGIASYIGAPLHIRGEFVGTIAFSSTESTTNFTDHHLKLVGMFGQWLSHEMERNATLCELRSAHEKLQRMASRDELTELDNRRGLADRFRRELARGRRNGHSLAVALVDFDHFKQINDRYGHATGDAVLQLFADHTIQSLRGADAIGRWGDEEFLVLLPDTSTATAISVIERLLRDVRSAHFMFEDTHIALTVSAGLTLTDCSENVDNILRRADTALYRAKTDGRDRFALF